MALVIAYAHTTEVDTMEISSSFQNHMTHHHITHTTSVTQNTAAALELMNLSAKLKTKNQTTNHNKQPNTTPGNQGILDINHHHKHHNTSAIIMHAQNYHPLSGT